MARDEQPVAPTDPSPTSNANPSPGPEPEAPRKPALPRPVVLAMIAGLIGFIGWQGWELFDEWYRLQHELDRGLQTQVVGYLDVNPVPTYAHFPADWFREEGEHLMLWSGWEPGVGHGWFRLGRGEVDRRRISTPIGRDVFRTIDHAIHEVAGGPRWVRVPPSAMVAGIEVAGVRLAYPIRVLDKVEAVNEVVEDRPILVTFSPFVPEEESVSVWDATLDGVRVTMGAAGYFLDRKPVFYDRGSESFWVEEGPALKAFAGRRRGSELKRIDRPEPVSWGEWAARHPEGRLVVGADRSKPRPAL